MICSLYERQRKNKTIPMEGSIIMSRKREIRPEEKVDIVHRGQAGEISISAASQKAGVGKETLRRWIAEVEGAAFFCRMSETVYIRRR